MMGTLNDLLAERFFSKCSHLFVFVTLSFHCLTTDNVWITCEGKFFISNMKMMVYIFDDVNTCFTLHTYIYMQMLTILLH